MNPALWLALAVIGGWQTSVYMQQMQQRHRTYVLAHQYADEVGKPLLVAGGPYGSSKAYFWRRILKMPAHSFGDVCLDIDPGACRDSVEQVVADIREIPYPDKHFGAAYASHILEHMHSIEDCEMAIDELLRVADRVFVVGPSKHSITSWIAPTHHLWVNQVGDTVIMEQR